MALLPPLTLWRSYIDASLDQRIISIIYNYIYNLYVITAFHFCLPLIESTGRESTGRVGFVLYQNDRLFLSKVYKNKLEENYSNRIVSGNVDGTVVHNVKIALNPQVSFFKQLIQSL